MYKGDFLNAYCNKDWLTALEFGAEVQAEELSPLEAAYLYEVGIRTKSVIGFPLVVEALKVFFGPKHYRSFLIANFHQKDSRVLAAMLEVCENPGIPYELLLDRVARSLGRGVIASAYLIRSKDITPPPSKRLPAIIKTKEDCTGTPYPDIETTLRNPGGAQALLDNICYVREIFEYKRDYRHNQMKAGVEHQLHKSFQTEGGKVLEKDIKEGVWLGTCEFTYPLLKELFSVPETQITPPFSAQVLGEEREEKELVSTSENWLSQAQIEYERGDLSAEEVLDWAFTCIGRWGDRP